jgi:outer membrane immunogenic protein
LGAGRVRHELLVAVLFACPIAAFLNQPPTGFSADTKGVIGGGQIGYNFQYVHWVFAAEADFDWTNADGSDTRSSSILGFLPVSATASTSLDWLGTVRGRVGYASGDLLVYATGGLAYGKVKESFSYTASFPGFGPFFTASGGGSDTQTGWTAGGGAELAIDKWWSLKGEYLFYDLGTRTSRLLGISLASEFPEARSRWRPRSMARLLAWASTTISTSQEADA